MADVAKLPATADKPSQKDNYEDENSPPKNDNSISEQSGNYHDSEYDTASDLDDDYDDGESLGANGEDDIDSENGSIVFDLERQRGDGQEQADFAKKVDEDRSNPQYIPKKGTFYEHDDRTADEPVSNESKTEELGEGGETTTTTTATTKSSTPTISASSKTMKKWQPASAVDRWSHDRFDENEQAPKSRTELVSAYGYDIRNEDGPPRARRRRHYGRGPNKYVRNWEDESAYIKSSGGTPQRKPRPEDFPALGDRDKKIRKSRSFREEKENRYDRQNDRTGGGGVGGGGGAGQRNNPVRKENGRIERRSNGKDFRGGRQNIEYKNPNKNRMNNNNDIQNRNSSERQIVENHRKEDNKVQVETVSFTNTKLGTTSQTERYNGHDNNITNQNNQLHRDIKDNNKVTSSNPPNMSATRQSPQIQSHISSRLQVQNRNDPSHVGSVQMHSIVNQNPDIQQSGPESGRTKRYSSLRQRSQNEVGLPQQQQQQQQQQQPPPPPQHVILQDQQHLLQANLMQLYHTQENIQAQMQSVSIQNLPTGGHQQKAQYQNVQPQYQPAGTAVSAYYAPANEFVASQQPPVPTPSQFPQQQTTAYIQTQSTPTTQITFSTQSQPPAGPLPAQQQQQQQQQLPTPMNYVQQTPQAPQPAPGTYQNFSGYPNYNTVGGTTYFVPPPQPPPRPVILPQRRPTNAIPILAPPIDKSKTKTEDDGKQQAASSNAPIGSAENIDHILDNMFVQRPPYQPPTRKSSSPATESVATSTNISLDEIPQQNNNSNSNTNNNNNNNSVTSGTNSSSPESRLEEAVQNLSLIEKAENPATNSFADDLKRAKEQDMQQTSQTTTTTTTGAANSADTKTEITALTSEIVVTQSETG